MADVSIKLAVGSLSIEVSGPQEYVEQKFTELLEKFLTDPLTVPTSSEMQSASVPEQAELIDAAGKRLSPAEFLRKLSHTNQLDRALALGYYLEKVEKASSFTTKDLLALTRQVKYPFANISESVSRLVGRGLMMSAGDKDGLRAYSLTATGEQMIGSMWNKV